VTATAPALVTGPAPHYLSRIRLRRDPGIAALAPLLLSGDALGHRMAWSAYATGDQSATRDFLFREMEPGEFLALAPRVPDGNSLFEVESKPWRPALVAGQRLGFSLRCNATVSRSAEAGSRGARHGVAYDALQRLPREERARRRAEVTHDAATGWLSRQLDGAATVETLIVEAARRTEIRREGKGAAVLDIMDLSGTVRVVDGALLVARIARGFGRGRAFGCGLLLLRRLD
jgi:CRISPR system Cascade subunit CasE